MKTIFILYLLMYLPCQSQMISTPMYSESVVSFETAKISQFNEKTKKYISEVFKSCSVLIENANTSTPSLTIDLPDIYYCKKVEVYSIRYEKDETSEYILYLIKDGKYMAAITIMYGVDYRAPESINISFTTISKAPVIKTYALHEFK